MIMIMVMVMIRTLVPVLLLGNIVVTCEDTNQAKISSVLQHNDTCKYSEGFARCGDQCIRGYKYCYCGNTTIDMRRGDQQCCVPPMEDKQCIIGRTNVTCAEGVVIGIHE